MRTVSIPEGSKRFCSRAPGEAKVFVHHAGKPRVFCLSVNDPDINLLLGATLQVLSPVSKAIPQHQIVPTQPDKLQTQLITAELPKQTDELISQRTLFLNVRTLKAGRLPAWDDERANDLAYIN